MEKTEVFDYMAANGHEKVLCFQNEDVGLRAVLAIHSTVLGPAAGGCRMWTYSDDLAAMEDALRLSKGMTYKYAAAGINLGATTPPSSRVKTSPDSHSGPATTVSWIGRCAKVSPLRGSTLMAW